MSEKPKNQPAFACAADGGHQEGMTLRDYFAGQALIGCLNNPTNQKICDVVSTQPIARAIPFDAALAKMAYSYADAMLKAREASDDR